MAVSQQARERRDRGKVRARAAIVKQGGIKV
jgi:hypothetical protein